MADTDKDDQPVLTEEEIEALVDHAVADTGYDDGEFRSHNFGAGDALTVGKWTELEGLAREHAEALEQVLQHGFGIEGSVEALAPFHAKCGDLATSMPERLTLVSTRIAPIEGESHLELPGTLLTHMVNHYFGGSSVPAPKLSGRVTPSEQRLGERFAREVLRTMVEIWQARLALEPGDLFVDITPDRLVLLPRDTGFVVQTFAIATAENEIGELRLMMPFDGLEAFEAQLKPRDRNSAKAAVEPEWEAKLQKAVPDIPVPISGQIAVIETNVRKLLALKVGMVIPIMEPREVKLTAHGTALARGSYGGHDGRHSVQITQFEGHDK